jgi:hypothetical protein
MISLFQVVLSSLPLAIQNYIPNGNLGRPLLNRLIEQFNPAHLDKQSAKHAYFEVVSYAGT